MTAAAVPLAAARGANSEVTLGLVAAAALLPGVVLAVPAGLTADRMDRVRTMIAADVVRAVAVGAAALALAVGGLHPAALMALAFVVGCGETLFVTASQSFLPGLVADADLDHANGRLQAATDAGREFAGPPLGSLAFRAVAWLPFGADALTYAVSAVLLRKLPRRAPSQAPAGVPHDRGIGPAWRVIRQSRPLAGLAVGLMALSCCGAAVLALLVLLVTDDWQLDDGWFGLALTLVACGATLAGVVAGYVRAHLSARVVLPLAVACNAGAYVVLGSAGALAALPALVVWGAAVTLGNITSVGIRQRLVPSEVLGRVMGLFRAFIGAGGVVGATAAGFAARSFGAGTVAVVAGLAQLPVVALLAWVLPGAGDSPERTT